MTRENKLALVVGFGLILLVGVLISDHFSTARTQQSADFAANRPVDPLSDTRRSDPHLIDLQDRSRSTAESLRAPLAVNTTEIAPEESAPAAPPEQPQSSGVQRVVMGEPVPGSRATENASRQQAQPSVPFIFHDVQAGETMTSIARRYYGDTSLVRELASFNGLDDPNALRVNHRLRIPASGDLVRGAQPSQQSQSNDRQPRHGGQASAETRQPSVYTTYTVKRGDTLSELSMELLGTSRRWRELYELNRDVIRDPDNLLAGTVLKVPRP